ncbi:phage related protein [Bartonella australis AUST/NH1]|uniref:Phage related protein n=1 Tax=Bartonella australis (strain Aust/NH1) TaxID=1094489 RepID=M1NRZ9_BARAA|nr:hypothetical protein [Bartonella australis]AGF74113.1 phage related protein [Bartonella australis AUST/NH1]
MQQQFEFIKESPEGLQLEFTGQIKKVGKAILHEVRFVGGWTPYYKGEVWVFGDSETGDEPDLTEVKYGVIRNYIEVLGSVFYRIIALRKFSLKSPRNSRNLGQYHYVDIGNIGGQIQGEWNLSQQGNCWIGYDATVCENVHIGGNIWIHGSKCISNTTRRYKKLSSQLTQ